MSYDLLKAQSIPKHPKNMSGVVFIVGTHPCYREDIDEAKQYFDYIDYCAVNDATELVHADYVATGHPEKLDQFLDGIVHGIEIHSRKKFKQPKVRDNEHVWNINVGGTSALFAVAAMLAIGYDEIVLCGCPMNGGGGYALRKHNGSVEDPRIGDMEPSNDIIQGWHKNLKRFKEENPLSDRVSSMSGVTQKIFGGL